jgi:hypothetical protein
MAGTRTSNACNAEYLLPFLLPAYMHTDLKKTPTRQHGNSPYDNVSTIVPLHPTCNPNKWETAHVNTQAFITTYPPSKDPDHCATIPSK